MSTVFAQELLGEDGVFLYPTFVDCANFHLEIFYKLFNVTYTLIMNALEVPVTNCPVGMNGQGLPIGIQVVFHQLSSRFVTLFSEARGFKSSTIARNM
jgi:fatty acid amide hydrolase 2